MMLNGQKASSICTICFTDWTQSHTDKLGAWNPKRGTEDLHSIAKVIQK